VVKFQIDGATAVKAAVIAQLSSSLIVQRIGDFSGDRCDDILWRDTDGATVEYQMDGDTLVIGQPST
jgi:Flp pilus assembly pilin Flp